ncbi:MAG: hypothetical protein IMZ53_01820 [Thermoplasmata archaeon]|nr:hypothetical protein [Thermoplasmata archaeon]
MFSVDGLHVITYGRKLPQMMYKLIIAPIQAKHAPMRERRSRCPPGDGQVEPLLGR